MPATADSSNMVSAVSLYGVRVYGLKLPGVFRRNSLHHQNLYSTPMLPSYVNPLYGGFSETLYLAFTDK